MAKKKKKRGHRMGSILTPGDVSIAKDNVVYVSCERLSSREEKWACELGARLGAEELYRIHQSKGSPVCENFRP